MAELLLQRAVRQFEERQFDARFLLEMGVKPIDGDNEGGPDVTEAYPEPEAAR
jgi:hypothetical protein